MSGRISPARRVAFDLLLELGRRAGSHSDELLRSEPVEALTPIDRKLVTTLVMGVLRWKLTLRRHISSGLTSAQSRLAEPVQTALELGALQLLLLDRIPARAAIFESVELTRHSGNSHAAGMVNAVLRKLAAYGKLDQSPGVSGSVGEIASAYAHPLWLVERWAAAFGLTAASAICHFNQCPPRTTIRLMTPEAETHLREEGLELESGIFVESARRVIKGDVMGTRAWAQGHVRIQDEGSQLIAELAGRGNAILDCCAAPGGKTGILAQRNPQASIVACDINPSRLRAMRSFAYAGNGRISFRVLDASRMPFHRQFDLALCDAPCSGTGTLARNPEIRHRLRSWDFLRQQHRQIRLLRSAMESLQVGGLLVYSTCSLEAEENEHVVGRALEGQKSFALVSWRDRVEALEREGILLAGAADRLTPPGFPAAPGLSASCLRTLPGIHPCDGFFAALLTWA